MIENLLKNKNLFFEATEMDESAADIRKELQNVTRPFKPLISIVETFWVCATRYLPKVKSYYRFSFKEMLSLVESVFADLKINEDNEITDEKVEILRRNLISKLLGWLYPMISFNDSIFFLFLVTFMINDGNWADLSTIIQNLSVKNNSKLTNDGQFSSLEFDELIEKLKICNFCDFFCLAKELISSYFGDKFENDFPFFQIESCIPSSFQSPSLIISNPKSKDSGPLMEILKYIKANDKINDFECLSLSDDDHNLDDIKKKIQNAFSRGNWILLNYLSPSKKAASLINDILYLISIPPIHVDFRLFINCYTTKYISTQLLSRSKIVTMNDFPSIQKNMLQICHNFSSIITNTTSKLIRQLFYIGALVYSQLKSRSFLQPFGFNSFFGLDESSFKIYINYSIKFAEHFEALSSQSPPLAAQSSGADHNKLSARSKSIIDAKNDSSFEVPFKNIRDFAAVFCFGPRTIERQDRRRLRAVLTQFFTSSVLGENQCSNSDQVIPNMSLFAIQSDNFLSFFTQYVMSRFPTFSMAEVMMADLEVVKPLVNWNLSKWASEPFLSILSKQSAKDEVNNIEGDVKYSIEEITEIEEKPLSPLSQFWLNEIKAFNSEAKKDLKKLKDEVKWKFIFNSTEDDEESFNRFYVFMNEKRKFLINAYGEVTVEEVNLKYLNDIRGFFNAYKLYYCLFNSVSSDQVSIEFDFANSNSFFVKIVGLSLFNGDVKDSKLFPIELEYQGEMKIFSQIPPIFMSIGQKVEKGKLFVCPLFRNVFTHQQNYIEEETENFIIDVELSATKGDRFWLLNSTALFVFVPQIFQ